MKALGRYVPVKLNVDIPKNAKVAQRYQVGPLPTLLVIRPDGKVLGGFLGFQPPAPFIQNLKLATQGRIRP